MSRKVTALVLVVLALLPNTAFGQQPTKGNRNARGSSARNGELKELRSLLENMQAQLKAQAEQITALHRQLLEQQARVQGTSDAAQRAQAAADSATAKAAAAQETTTKETEGLATLRSDVEDLKLNQQNAAISTQQDQARILAAENLLGRFRLSGDIRVRGESFHQGYTGCAACVDRYRARIRVRLGVEGKLNEDFIGGLYLASGGVVNGAPSFTDPVSTNETLTSFFERKTFGLDRAYITYSPRGFRPLQLTGGKFAFNWQRTVLTFDSDLNPEGFTEKLSFDVNTPVVKNLTFQAMQLLFNEVGNGTDAHAVGGQVLTRLQLGRFVTITPSYMALNWNQADSIAQAAFPVTLPQPVTPAAGTPLPQPTAQLPRIINANAFTNATRIVGTGTNQRRAFVSGFLYNDFVVDANITTPWTRFPLRLLGEYLTNSRAASNQGQAAWLEASLGQLRNRNDVLFGYSFARIEQDAIISQFNESDLRAPTNVVQHRVFGNWLVAPNTTATAMLWVGRTLDTRLQNASRAPGIAAGQQDPWLKRLQLDVVYRF